MKFFEPKFYTKEYLENAEYDEINYPFSSIDAIYNGKKHQYFLTEEYFTERGHNLQHEIQGNDPEKVKHFLEYLTMKVYNYIYGHCRSTRDQINFMIAIRGLRGWDMYEYREQFLEAMYIEGEYLLANGDISYITGIDIDTMQNMSGDVMRNQDRDFHKDCIALLKQLGLNYFGTYKFIVTGKGENW